MDASEILSKSGLKCTRQSIDVLTVLINSEIPLTADDIYGKTKNISLTVHWSVFVISEL